MNELTCSLWRLSMKFFRFSDEVLFCVIKVRNLTGC